MKRDGTPHPPTPHYYALDGPVCQNKYCGYCDTNVFKTGAVVGNYMDYMIAQFVIHHFVNIALILMDTKNTGIIL